MKSNIQTAEYSTLKNTQLNNDVKSIGFARSREFKSKIFFGRGSLLDEQWIKLLLIRQKSQHFIITDKTVGSLYADKLNNILCKHGFNVCVLTMPEGEKAKTLSNYDKITSCILSQGLDRESYIIGLGGGVVNNMAGFIASTLYRGVGLIQVPTTLLAQVDAAIDFKQAIDGPGGKNLIGSYYPAGIIVIDPELLKSLAIRQMKCGMAEAIKHALTQDEGFFVGLQSYKGKLYDKQFLSYVIKRTITLKVPLLNDSFDEKYSEMLPQYGHAIGHAIEQASEYKLLHGEAIAIGMCATAEISRLLKQCNNDVVMKHYEILSKFGLPTKIPRSISDNKIMSLIKHDKHYLKDHMRAALVAEVGLVSNVGRDCVFSIEHDIIKLALAKNRASTINDNAYENK